MADPDPEPDPDVIEQRNRAEWGVDSGDVCAPPPWPYFDVAVVGGSGPLSVRRSLP